jgi:poly-beta-hydroxybutyrate-responsive repressor
MLSTTLLAMLRNWNAYGYQLAQEMSKAGLPAFDFGTIYRTLRQLERSGLVSSFWDTSPSGPARRMYSLTQTGDAFLSSWIDMLQRYQSVLQSAAEAYKNRDPGLRAGLEEGDEPSQPTREADHA